jgi:hypothetical protein
MSCVALAHDVNPPAPKGRAGSKALRIGEPNDAFEQETDRVAGAIASGGRAAPDWSIFRMSIAPPLQRKCTCGASAKGECQQCEAQKLQRKRDGSIHSDESPSIVGGVLRSSGWQLDHSTQRFFAARLGHDFNQVRIHIEPLTRCVDWGTFGRGKSLLNNPLWSQQVNFSFKAPKSQTIVKELEKKGAKETTTADCLAASACFIATACYSPVAPAGPVVAVKWGNGMNDRSCP